MPSFAAVIFDNDGLLLDTEEAWTRAEVALFARRGRTFTTAHKRDLLGKSGPTVGGGKLAEMLELPAAEGPALWDELHALVMEEARHDVPPRPGALALLDALATTGVPLGLASASVSAFVERTWIAAGRPLPGPFSAIVCGDDVAHLKPAPDIYLEACRRLRVEPSACAALEDSPTGVASATAAGLYTIGVPYFADQDLPGVDLRAPSLAAAEVAVALGLERAA